MGYESYETTTISNLSDGENIINEEMPSEWQISYNFAPQSSEHIIKIGNDSQTLFKWYTDGSSLKLVDLLTGYEYSYGINPNIRHSLTIYSPIITYQGDDTYLITHRVYFHNYSLLETTYTLKSGEDSSILNRNTFYSIEQSDGCILRLRYTKSVILPSLAESTYGLYSLLKSKYDDVGIIYDNTNDGLVSLIEELEKM